MMYNYKLPQMQSRNTVNVQQKISPIAAIEIRNI